MKKITLLLLSCFFSSIIFAQDYFPKNDGVKEKNNNYTAFTNATLFVTPSEKVKNGTLLIQNGKVVASGKSVDIPENSVVIDLKGKFIYPSFIDAYTNFGIKKPKKASRNGRSAQYKPSREGFYWNDHIKPEQSAIDDFSYDKKT